MPGILQEKFQVDYPDNRNDDASSGWVSDQSARVKKGTRKVPGDHNHHGPDPSTNAIMQASLPPGMDIEDQETSDQRQFATTMGGESDVSHDWNAEAVRDGFQRKRMRPTDDEYTKAHQDAFYDEITVDGDTGFAERNNMLDRL
jgi:hypothetical protein